MERKNMEKKSLKKMIALSLSAVMTVSGMLTACSSAHKEESKSATEAQTDAKAELTAAAEKQKDGESTSASETTDTGDITSWILEDDTNMSGEVNFWIPFKGNQGMDAMIAAFNEVYPNIKVNLNSYNNNSDGNVSVNVAMDAGEVDVLASFGLNLTYKRWSNGMFMDLTDMCKEDGIDLAANWGTDKYVYDDRIYTFPCGGISYYVAINMSAWNEAGLGEIPTEWTWDEYMDACAKMTKKDASGKVLVYGGSDYHSTNYMTYPYAQIVGKNPYYKEDGTSSFDDPIIIDAFERELKAELEDQIWFPKATYRGDNLQAQMTFCQGQTASTIINNVTRFLHDKETYPDVNWITAFAPYPVVEKGQTNYMSGVPNYSHAGISVNCQDKAAAWAFLKWYSSYGVKWLTAAGHQPCWRGTEPGTAVKIIYGSEEEAKKWIDIESFTRVVGNTSNPSFYEDEMTAYSDVVGALNEEVMLAINGEKTAKEALTEAAVKANQLIQDAK